MAARGLGERAGKGGGEEGREGGGQKEEEKRLWGVGVEESKEKKHHEMDPLPSFSTRLSLATTLFLKKKKKKKSESPLFRLKEQT